MMQFKTLGKQEKPNLKLILERIGKIGQFLTKLYK